MIIEKGSILVYKPKTEFPKVTLWVQAIVRDSQQGGYRLTVKDIHNPEKDPWHFIFGSSAFNYYTVIPPGSILGRLII